MSEDFMKYRFRKLEDISLKTSFLNMLVMLQVLDADLSSIKLMCSVTQTVPRFSELALVLERRFRSIKTLTIVLDTDPVEEVDAPFDLSCLHSLSQCRTLQEFVFYYLVQGPFIISDARVVTLCSPWANLRSLGLFWLQSTPRPLGAVPKEFHGQHDLSIKGIAAITHHCPKLRDAEFTHISMISTYDPPVPKFPLLSFNLTIDSCTVDVPHYIACIMVNTWPGLLLDIYRGGGMAQLWEEINRVAQGLRKAKETAERAVQTSR
ncbi:hypothetical protein CALVIDRAFT_567786 [Calocera viscosa TUFC12733]|uniref:F-box domain-containing protein n=1 Tax=Calocera viscosa (strain TUFC12733) TaxID=1330018 RepID=A0A167HR63_CALVF|nr:hypothetical protein CALVIDRAFT_567786 [Calocera viscosa TUFC12733]